MNLIPDNFEKAAATFMEARESLIYKIAWARAALKAPAGRYPPKIIEEVRAMVKSIEERFPNLARK